MHFPPFNFSISVIPGTQPCSSPGQLLRTTATPSQATHFVEHAAFCQPGHQLLSLPTFLMLMLKAMIINRELEDDTPAAPPRRYPWAPCAGRPSTGAPPCPHWRRRSRSAWQPAEHVRVTKWFFTKKHASSGSVWAVGKSSDL